MATITIRTDDGTRDELEKIAETQGVTLSDLLRVRSTTCSAGVSRCATTCRMHSRPSSASCLLSITRSWRCSTRTTTMNRSITVTWPRYSGRDSQASTAAVSRRYLP